MTADERILHAQELAQRRELRDNLKAWARFYAAEQSWTLAKHHELLLEKLQAVADGKLINSSSGLPCRNLIFLLPPGSAKSQYTSIVFPAWFIQRRIDCRILACSHSATLIEGFSRVCRNTIQRHWRILGYNLQPDSRSVESWSTTNSGQYRCAGVGAGLAGYRADCLLIDDYLGSEEDADSKLIREKIWLWYQNDALPRLKPNGIRVIVANRRHEDDLVGRLLEKEPHKWEVVKVPFFAEENDPLGRAIGERIWPEWFDEKVAEEVLSMPPRTQAGLYQQRPAPEEGNYFKKEWLVPYTQEELSKLMSLQPRIYGAADWAVSEAKGSNKTCIGFAAMGIDGCLYLLPDVFWKVAGPKEIVAGFMELLKRYNPLAFWSESGHISKSLGPFIREEMLLRGIHNYISEVTPSRDKETRAQSIRGRMSLFRVKFPVFSSWWNEAMHELLMFPGGKNDDFVDMLAHIGMGLQGMVPATTPRRAIEESLDNPFIPTLAWVKKSSKEERNKSTPRYHDR